MGNPTYCPASRHQSDNYLSRTLKIELKESRWASSRSLISPHQVTHMKLYCLTSIAPTALKYLAKVYKLFKQASETIYRLTAIAVALHLLLLFRRARYVVARNINGTTVDLLI